MSADCLQVTVFKQLVHVSNQAPSEWDAVTVAQIRNSFSTRAERFFAVLGRSARQQQCRNAEPAKVANHGGASVRPLIKRTNK